MIKKMITFMLFGKNYDITPSLYADFPKSRNFDVLILGGSRAYRAHGNYTFFGNKKDNRKILSLCYPYRTNEINFEILRMYHSYLKKGGRVIYYSDPVEDDLVGRQKYLRNIRILHKIQRTALGVEYSKLDYIRNIFRNHKLSLVARRYAQLKQTTLPEVSTSNAPGAMADFCKTRGYELDYIPGSIIVVDEADS